MSTFTIKVIKRLRWYLHKLFRIEDDIRGRVLPISFTEQAASDSIKELLESGKPCMICRFGSSELNATLVHYYQQQNNSFSRNAFEYILGKKYEFWWDDHVVYAMTNNAGFFPKDISLLEKYGALMLEDVKEIDILGSWLKEEKKIHHYFPNATILRLPDLEPYYYEKPWSAALKGKKVLVIHPFEESIQQQYLKRKDLFENPDVLPDFDLKTIKAVQSIAFSEVHYESWFEALDDMCKQIDATDFDIAIIGCGAYGLPLAAHVKRIGKQSVHLGSATQVMFGVKGKKWENTPFFKEMFNEHWESPLPQETPQNHSNVEKGCYW